MNYTYILQCSDGSLYTGWTNHLEARIQAHNAGLVYYECIETKEEAMRREYAIKQLNRQQKLKLIAQRRRDSL